MIGKLKHETKTFSPPTKITRCSFHYNLLLRYILLCGIVVRMYIIIITQNILNSSWTRLPVTLPAEQKM